MEKSRGIDFSTVLASSVHDMKNSLCMLIQSIESLSARMSEKNIEGAQELAQIHYEAARLNTNLLQMLALYRARKDALPVDIDEWYLDEVLEELVAKNTLYIENKNLEVEFDIEDDLMWIFDNDLISNLLNDIFVNAMRYCQKKILLTAHEIDGVLQVQISDDGDGYPDNMLLSSTSRPADIELNLSRTGLGIYFAQMIANAHVRNGKTGNIELQNGGALNGSVFTLTLP
ncbi:MAG: HAMP domain-containing histidine kinase [Gammaproteobacteria bacterium]|nr:HAMP domain-containing histidine kinase [Gammaproteobacteria bacterium]